MIKKITVLLLIALSLGSCVSSKKIVYFKNVPENQQKQQDSLAIAASSAGGTKYETKLKPDDLLMIIVSAPDPLAAAPFNLPAMSVTSNSIGSLTSAGGAQQFQTYLIDNQGKIQFPIVGSIQLGGLTRIQALEKLQAELKKYINSPIVNLRILNYKVSVMGEVLHPGVFPITSERLTLPEAISMAGDMTIYGVRSEVLVLREIEGVKTYNYVDMTNPQVINSPYYYLTQNDIVYVRQNKTKINSSVVGPNTTLIISSLSLLLTTIALLIR